MRPSAELWDGAKSDGKSHRTNAIFEITITQTSSELVNGVLTNFGIGRRLASV